MNREQIETHFGSEWVDFMSPFCESPKMDELLGKLRAEKEKGSIVIPDTASVFRCFRETPLSILRVILVGSDPYPLPGYSTGLAFGFENEFLDTPASLEKIMDAIEKDCYSGLNLDKPAFDKSLVSWAKQGVLLLNSSLTIGNKKNEAGEIELELHKEIWKPFTKYVLDTLCLVKKDLIFLGWGVEATEALADVNVFFHTMPPTVDHPSMAVRKQVAWECNHFSFTNAAIVGQRLGEKIKW